MSSRDEAPIACTLGGNDYHGRLAWIAQLNRDGLQSHRRGAMTLELRYAAAVRERVHQLVRQEAECCAFLEFAVNESDDQVSVTITVPDRAGAVARDLLAPFLATDTTRNGPAAVASVKICGRLVRMRASRLPSRSVATPLRTLAPARLAC